MLGGHAGDPVRQDYDDGFICLYENPAPDNDPAAPGTGTIRAYPGSGFVQKLFTVLR
jgi:hypothetical protein